LTRVTWDQVGQRFYETGVDHGVLYIPNNNGVYVDGYGWNGLTGITDTPSGAEPSAQYADNIKYLNLVSAEEFGGTITAYTYPDEWAQCDGSASPQVGIVVGQQGRKTFGLAYRTRIGNDLQGPDYGYKLHLVWGALASPSEKANTTINDSPEAVEFSWEFTTTPVPVTDLKPTSTMVIDSTKVDADALAALEDILYGTVGVDPMLPSPDDVLALFAGTVTEATATAPTYNGTTHVITIPTVTGVTYYINDEIVTGAQPALTVGQTKIVEARPNAGYVLAATSDDDWAFSY
jgi:hypothetical protein